MLRCLVEELELEKASGQHVLQTETEESKATMIIQRHTRDFLVRRRIGREAEANESGAGERSQEVQLQVQDHQGSLLRCAEDCEFYQISYAVPTPHQAHIATGSNHDVRRRWPPTPPFEDPFAAGATWMFQAGFHYGDYACNEAHLHSNWVAYPDVVRFGDAFTIRSSVAGGGLGGGCG